MCLPQPDPKAFEAALDELPVFPLPKTVLFPGALLPLHVFEPRYCAMVRECLASHKTMAVALLRDGKEGNAFEPIAGVGVIVDAVNLPDGRYNILVQGRARARLEELPFLPPYRRARATLVQPPAVAEPSACDVAALLSSAAGFAAAMRTRNPDFELPFPPQMSPTQVADLAAHYLVFDPRERQALLEELDPRVRIRRTAQALALQTASIRTPRSPGELN